jgi:hypothetical protein
MNHFYKGVKIIIDENGKDLFFVHVVREDGTTTKEWLKEAWKYRNSASLARYFYEKHILGKTNPLWLKKAEKTPVVPAPHTLKGFECWLQERMFQEVGFYGNYDTPMARYIKETHETWRPGMFLVNGVYENRPRWMTRFQNYCEELPAVYSEQIGASVLATLHEERWNIKDYDLHPHMERMYNR